MFEGTGYFVLWACAWVGVFYVTKWTLRLLFGLFTYLRMVLGSRLWKRNLAVEYGGKWAVVTGSTDGIGKEFARQLAQRGMKIVLISRTLEKLTKVEEEIKDEFGVETQIIAADFSNGRPIYEGIANGLKGKDIGILVNNVGFSVPRVTKFNDISEDDMWRFVNVNVAPLVAMTKIVLPQMLARKRGAIINLSSILAVHPCPYVAVYSATKTFTTYFSRALELECRDSGITVQTLQPSFIPTNMTASSKLIREPDSFMTPSVRTFVSAALPSLGYLKVTAGTWDHVLQSFISEQLSDETAMWLLLKVGEHLEKNAEPKKIN